LTPFSCDTTTATVSEIPGQPRIIIMRLLFVAVFIRAVTVIISLVAAWWFFVALTRLAPPFIQLPKKRRRQVQETAGSRNGADQKVKLKKRDISSFLWIRHAILLLLLCCYCYYYHHCYHL
jgi:hypothetical protein